MTARVEAEGLTKRFGGVVALDGMHLTASAGEVHALIGENGAGKSTLMQVLSGTIRPDSGTIRVAGRSFDGLRLGDARAARIATVYQELSLIPDLTVAENLWFGREPLTPLRTRSQRALRARTAELFAALGLDGIDPDALARDLPIAEQQLVEIARAIATDPEVLILDEPTSALHPRRVDWLVDTTRSFARRGGLAIFISHRLAEVRRVADRVTVMRGGRHVATSVLADVDDAELIVQMLGRRLEALFPPRVDSRSESVALSVDDLSVGHRLRGASFELHEGEVLGVAGLQGHGQRELFESLVGLHRHGGSIAVRGRAVRIQSPRHALDPSIGIALLPEDRRTQGLLMPKSVRVNATLASLGAVSRAGVISAALDHSVTDRLTDQLRIGAGDTEQAAGTLSGGNQQKLVLAKLLATDARILLLFDPTRGVDLGTKAEMFSIMRDLAARGYAILFHSTDLPELANVADRCLAMSYGRIADELAGDQLTEERILRATMSGEAA